MAPVYCTQADFESFCEGWVTDDASALNRMLERAERDIDSLAAILPPVSDSDPHKFDPDEMNARDKDVLKRATCAQAEYRFEMGEAFFKQGQYERVQGPDFETSGRLPWIGPKVYRELSGTGLIPLSTTTGPARTAPPWADFSYNLDTD